MRGPESIADGSPCLVDHLRGVGIIVISLHRHGRVDHAILIIVKIVIDGCGRDKHVPKRVRQHNFCTWQGRALRDERRRGTKRMLDVLVVIWRHLVIERNLKLRIVAIPVHRRKHRLRTALPEPFEHLCRPAACVLLADIISTTTHHSCVCCSPRKASGSSRQRSCRLSPMA